MAKYVIIVDKEGIPIPIMQEDSDSMAIFKTYAEAEEFAQSHILCKAHQTVIVDYFGGEAYLS